MQRIAWSGRGLLRLAQRTRALLRAVAVVIAVGVPASARAQDAGVIAGVVVSERGAAPVAGAQVGIEGTTRGASTDAGGRFTIGGLAAGDVRLTVRRIGFSPATVAARVGATDVRVVLAERVAELDQVVVTGTAGVASRRAVGNAVSTVRAADIVATQPVRNVQDLLTGRAAGVSVVASSGQVGTGARIRVRGASSLSLGNDPLIYVDGVRVDNAQATGPTNQAFGSASVSRINDFNPGDIESIEVIKGPAAATLYGTEASNGVVQIITKRGAAGSPVWNFTARLGTNWLPGWNSGDGYYTNYGVVPRAGAPVGTTLRDTVTVGVAQLNDSLNARFGNDIFRTGTIQNFQTSVGGGAPAFRYYVGLNRDEEQGVERINRLNRTGVRLNLTAVPSRAVTVQASTGYTTARTYLPYESGGGGTTWATYFASPAFLYSGGAPNNPQLGFRSGPPNVYYQAYNIFQDANRFTSSVQVTNRPAEWFNHRLILGLDQLDEDNQQQGPRNDVIFNSYAAFSDVGCSAAQLRDTVPCTTGGFLTVGTRNVRTASADYTGNLEYRLGNAWRGVTSAGGQFYGRRTRGRLSSAAGFPAAGVLALNAAVLQRLDGDSLFDNNTLGGFVQQQAIWNDRLFVTAAVRRDDNSAFGTDYPAVTYPKASISYVVSEEPSLPLPAAITTLRLRAAFGGSGLQPGAFDAIRTYAPVGGFLTPTNIGNNELGPETSYETELGVDAGAFDDRYGAEVTYFDGRTRDAILSRQAAPSEGFPGFQLFNAGRVDRRGLEWLFRAQPVRGDNFTLDLGLSGSVTKYEIRSLGDSVNSVSLSSQIQHTVGYAPGAWWDRRVVSATYNPTTKRATDLRCDDGQGGSTPCYNAANQLVAPRVFLGNSVPTREGSFNAGATILRAFRLNAFVDYRGGYSKLDGNRRVRCNVFSLCEENYYPDAVREDGTPKFDPVTLAAVQGGTAFTYDLIRNASFVRFRELALTYTLPSAVSRRFGSSNSAITVAGRNLRLWTKYSGLEPEASFNGGTRGGAFGQWEQNVLPQTRSFVTTFNLSF